MEQEFNDQKHVTSVILCVSMWLRVCISHRQPNKFTQKINRTDFYDIYSYNKYFSGIACQEYFQ